MNVLETYWIYYGTAVLSSLILSSPSSFFSHLSVLMFPLFVLHNNKAQCLATSVVCHGRSSWLRKSWIDKMQVVYFSCPFIVAAQFEACYGGLNRSFSDTCHFCRTLVLRGCQLDLGGGVYRLLHCIKEFIIVCFHIARPLCSPTADPKVEWHQSALTCFAFWQSPLSIWACF